MRPGVTAAHIAAISSPRVMFATLLEVDFPGDPVRLHAGWGRLEVNGKTYLGSGLLGSVSESRENVGGRVSGASYQLSGVGTPEGNAIMAALGKTAENPNIEVRLMFALFDPVTGRTIGAPILLRQDYLDTSRRDHFADGASLTVTAEPPGLDRTVRGARKVSAADQARQYPDDTGLTHLANVGVTEIKIQFDE
jgi:hypothetical protein